MSAVLFVLVIAAILPVFSVINLFFRWVAEGDPYLRSLEIEASRDQVERPQSWRN